ncbi:hypothetical protein NLG97_g2139 [Lecanicillium saksenae]|uniref:Uncharacterized protein n=1 Tax=Lecanicillium saksenae TaxID=468837 RepID=A0ACC1R1Q9_9HYPO|nr:hypothetical protein NLG97_g2139 [Lecanicillium saksenae]
MVSSRRNDIRCQLCGVSGNVGRMRLASESPEAASRCMRGGVPMSNESECVGCFVVTDDGAEDEDDAADVSFIPEDAEDPKDAKYEYMPTPPGIAGEDCFDDISDDDDDYNDEDSEMDMDDNSKSYRQFLTGLPSDNCNIIVPLTEEYKKRDQTWRSREHISGPNCVLHNAYSGSNITAEELRGCNTLQLLCPKPSDWEAEKGDEDFETQEECPAYLSGLRDHFDSKSNAATVFVPIRHQQEEFNVHNWASAANNRYLAAMPFHPACFEVFKRASLKRFNTIDVTGLMGWYQVESTYHFTDKVFPHDEAIKRSTKNQVWDHVEGDEWIAANPCFVPALHREMQQLATEESFSGPHLGDAADFKDEIDEIAQMTLSSEASSNLPQSFYFGHIRHEMPWIWETWCARAYSGWATKSQSEIAKDPLAISHQREYLKSWIKAIEVDGESSTQKRAQLRDLNAQLKDLEAQSYFIPEPVTATLLPRHGTDWRKLYFALQNMEATSNGLRNRERVWRCCNYILDRIELQRKKGKIDTNNNVRLPRDKHKKGGDFYNSRSLNFADDYSESEAEFSDGDGEDMEMDED